MQRHAAGHKGGAVQDLSLLQEALAGGGGAAELKHPHNDQVILSLTPSFAAPRQNPVCDLLLDLEYFRLVPDVVPHIVVVEDILIRLGSFGCSEQIEGYLGVDNLVPSSLNHQKRHLIILERCLALQHPSTQRTDRPQTMPRPVKQPVFFTVFGIFWIFAAIAWLQIRYKPELVWQEPLQQVHQQVKLRKGFMVKYGGLQGRGHEYSPFEDMPMFETQMVGSSSSERQPDSEERDFRVYLFDQMDKLQGVLQMIFCALDVRSQSFRLPEASIVKAYGFDPSRRKVFSKVSSSIHV